MQRRGEGRFHTARSPRLRGRRRDLSGGVGETGLTACSRAAALLVYEAVLPALPLCVGRIRRELDEALAGLDVPAARRRDVALVVTEAASNTVRHAYEELRPGPVYVAAAMSGRSLVLTVSDCGRGMQAGVGRPGAAGLSLIGRLADSLRIAADPMDRGTQLSIVFRQATPAPGGDGLCDLLHDGIPARADIEVLRDYAEMLAFAGAPTLDGVALEHEAYRALDHAKRSRHRAWTR